jgi:hypothetical protein
MIGGTNHKMGIFHNEHCQPRAETAGPGVIVCRNNGALCLSGEGWFGNARHGTPTESRCDENKHGDRQHSTRTFISLLALFCIVIVLLSACDSTTNTTSNKVKNQSISTTNNGVITYSTSPQDVLIRTFYGGGKLGSFEYSPEISIYGDGSYILGPGLQMRAGQLGSDAPGQLLHTLVDVDGLLKFTTRQFYDIPDQNATFLQLMLNGTSYTFQYGPFGNLQESAQDMDAYHRLGAALTSITSALNGPTHPYSSRQMALLVHQDFSPDLSQTIPSWPLADLNLYNLAIYECGAIPQDQTGPNADTGCLTYTVPHNALLLSSQQQQAIRTLLNGQAQGVFLDLGQYYSVTLRFLLPDEPAQRTLAMLGSAELTYAGVPLQSGPVPTPTPTP